VRNIAIIPARSGSKGLPDKNIRDLYGMPLMAYSIVAALESGCFDTVMASTDSEHYAKIAQSYGAEVPFLRSELTSSDKATSWDTVLEVIDNYEEIGKVFDTFCLLQPTSPLRTSDDIQNAYEIFKRNKAISVQSITKLDHPISWCGQLGVDGSLDGFNSRESDGPRQKQDTYYRPNGAIYIANILEFRKDQFLYRDGCYAYIMPNEKSVDIDTDFDFKFAEFLMREKNYEGEDENIRTKKD
jgi:CMP-N-acetylneuraminic acid synthetase